MEGRTTTNAEETICRRDIWYGIVDGRYRYGAVKQLINRDGKWAEFRWTVTKVTSVLPTKRYRQFSRMQNMRHSPNFYVQFILEDVVYNQSMENGKLNLKGGRVTAASVSSAYCGDNRYGVVSFRQTEQTAIRLPSSVI